MAFRRALSNLKEAPVNTPFVIISPLRGRSSGVTSPYHSLNCYGGNVDLPQRIAKINSKEDLADFVAALRLDLEANPEEWENSTLERAYDS